MRQALRRASTRLRSTCPPSPLTLRPPTALAPRRQLRFTSERVLETLRARSRSTLRGGLIDLDACAEPSAPGDPSGAPLSPEARRAARRAAKALRAEAALAGVSPREYVVKPEQRVKPRPEKAAQAQAEFLLGPKGRKLLAGAAARDRSAAAAESSRVVPPPDYGRLEVGAYLAARMPFTFSAIRRVLMEAAAALPADWAPAKVLDYGAGPGTAGLAAAATWPGADTANGWVAVERSRRAERARRFHRHHVLAFILFGT